MSDPRSDMFPPASASEAVPEAGALHDRLPADGAWNDGSAADGLPVDGGWRDGGFADGVFEILTDSAALLHFRQLFKKSSDAILLIRGGRIVDLNPATLVLFHCTQATLMLGRRLLDFSPLQQPDGAVSALRYALLAERTERGGNCRYDWRFLNCRGQLFWAEVLLTSVTVDQQSLLYAVIRDISTRKLAEHALRLAAQVFDHARDAILVTDPQRRIIAVNQAYTEITGFSAADMIGHTFSMQCAAPDGLDGVEPAPQHRIWAELASAGHWQGEIAGRRKNRENYPAWLSLTLVRDSAGHVSNYLAMLSDITERKKSEQHTRHLAEHDFLTDLPNRVLLLDRLSLALVAARRKGSMLAILFLDLDHFKHINDSMGHHVGDLLLKEVARRLIKCVRGVDTVSRQGGDEFILILADVGGADQAAHVSASVLQSLSQPYLIADVELQVSASIGISMFPSDGDELETLIRNADIAMYHAKTSGRNDFRFFDAEMHARIVERTTFENGLRRALESDEFIIEYQPQIDVASGAMVGAEALIRWQHPQLGLLAPQRFIAVAEESGLMIPIGNWILQQACRQARLWQLDGHALTVAVNLSAAQFVHKDLVDSVAAALHGSGLAPHLLELELTEAIIMKSESGVAAILDALHRLGVRLTVDDFGTGYSRLGLLRDYPIDKLSIDRSFMACIGAAGVGAAGVGAAGVGAAGPGAAPAVQWDSSDGEGSDDDDGIDDGEALLGAIIAMARGLKLVVSAAGVENAAQLDFLRRHGCDQYQGFHASAAMLAAELGRSILA